MKRFLIVFALCLLVIQGLDAQTLIINATPSRYVTTGIITGSVGCGAILFGGVAALYNSSNSTTDVRNTDLAIMGVGFGIFAIGGGLIFGGLYHDKYFKWSLVAPKKNQIGLAYNF